MATFQGKKGTAARAESDSHGVKEGFGHFMLEDAEEKDNRVQMSLVCLAHEDAGSVGGTVRETLWTSGKDDKSTEMAMVTMGRWAVKLGLCTAAELDSDDQIDLDFAAAVGRQCVLKVELGKERQVPQQDGSTQPRRYMQVANFGRAIWHPSDSAVADANVPLDFQALADAGIEPPEPSKPKTMPANAAASAAAPQQQRPAQPAGRVPVQRQTAPAPAAQPAATGFSDDDI